MPITISYGNPALVGAASFAIGREKAKMKSGANAAKMAQGMLDRRDKKRDDERNRYDRLNKEGADRQQKSAIEQGRIAQDQDEARMRAEAAKNQANQRARERGEDFDFRRESQQAGFDQRDREAAARARAEQEKRAREQGNLPPSSKYFPPSSGGGGGMPSGGMPSGGAPVPSGSPVPDNRAYFPNGQPVPSSLQGAIDQALAESDNSSYSPNGQPVPPSLPRAIDQPILFEQTEPPQSTQQDAANSRGFVPQRTMGAQRAMAGRQQRYAREEAGGRALSAGQQKRAAELNAYQDQITSGSTAHLDEEQKQSALNQINQEQQKIQQNPSGSEIPTLDSIVNDAIANVNIGGQELPVVMGENGQPQVLGGYTPPQQGGGAPQQGGGAPQQGGDGNMLQDAPPEGFAVDPYGGEGSGIFSSTGTLDKSAAGGLAWSMDKKGYDTNIIEGTGRDKGKYSVQISKKPAEVVKPEKVDSFKPIPVSEWSRDGEAITQWRLENPKYKDWSDEKIAKLRSGKPYQDYLKMAQGEVPKLDELKPKSNKFEGGDRNASPADSSAKAEVPEPRRPPLIDPKAGNDDGSPYVDPADPERQQRLKDAMEAKKAKDAKDASNAKRKTPEQLNKMQAESNRKQGNAATRYNTDQAKKKYDGNADSFINDPKTTAKEARELIEDLIESRRQ